MEQKQRREPRYPFIAAAELLEENSGSRMTTRISDLSLNGCYVDTVNPLPDGTLVHLTIFTETHSFEAPATVVYSHAFMGMGMKFRDVQPKSEEVLRLWLPQTAEQTNKAHG
ncbi:MAG TPA: PilZ domain-containing protein [Candidatus Acidoferrum sp.]|nr:PilZ domain-containing protein [Candidatus Acidoferrum sp.]